MFDISWLLSLASHFPLDGMDMRFMQQALLALVLLAPMTAALGVQVVHYRMAFFSDAVGHSAFAGVAVGLLLGIHHRATAPCPRIRSSAWSSRPWWRAALPWSAATTP